MSGWYCVTYQIGSGGRMTGFGSIELEMDSLPRVGTGDVLELSQRITDLSHRNGTLSPGAGVLVTAWSRMEQP